MALIKMKPGFLPPERSIGGTTYYVRNGQAVARNRVTPVAPRTVAQRVEVSAQSNAAKAWSNAMTPEQQACWLAADQFGLNGYWLWNLVASVWNWVFELFPPLDCPDVDVQDVSIDDVIFDSCSGSLQLTINVANGIGDELAYVVAGSPLSPGRTAGPDDLTTIARRVPIGVPVDLTADWLLYVGPLPVEGASYIIGVRVASASVALVSALVTFNGFTTCGGGCTATPNPTLCLVFGTGTFLIEAVFDDGLTTLVNVSLLSARGFQQTDSFQISPGTPTEMTFSDPGPDVGLFPVIVRFESNETSAVCEAVSSVEVWAM